MSAADTSGTTPTLASTVLVTLPWISLRYLALTIPLKCDRPQSMDLGGDEGAATPPAAKDIKNKNRRIKWVSQRPFFKHDRLLG